jgi:hypothetical protein
MPLSNIDHRLFKTHRYGLVDASLRDEVPAHWPQAVVAPNFLENDTARCPLLVDVSALTPHDQGELLQRLDAQCTAREFALFSLVISSDDSIETLASHLAKRMVVRLEQGGAASQFRYFDPGTFVQLPRIIGDVGMAWLLGGVQSVAVPWAGHWETYVKPQAPAMPVVSFSLTQHHLKALLDLSTINRAASQLPAPTNQQDWTQRCESIAKHVQRAEQHGLNLLEDKVCFALHAMQHHPAFDQHGRIMQLLATLRQSKPADELDYQELSARISPDEWQTIAQELSVNLANSLNTTN